MFFFSKPLGGLNHHTVTAAKRVRSKDVKSDQAVSVRKRKKKEKKYTILDSAEAYFSIGVLSSSRAKHNQCE